MPTPHKQVHGVSAEAVNGDVDKTVIAAQGAGTKLKIRSGVIAINVAANDTGGVASLEDGAGGSKLLTVNAGAIGNIHFDFGDDGPILSDNTLLNLTVEGAGTTQATAQATVTAKVLGA